MDTKSQVPAPDRGAASREDVELAKLLRAAGPRSAPPERDKEIVKGAALAQWQWTVRRERRKRAFRRGAIAFAAAAALAAVTLHPALRSRLGFGAAAPVGTLEVAVGAVLGGMGTALHPLATGEELSPGQVLETPASGAALSRAVVTLAGGSSLRLDAGSRLWLLSPGVLALDRGAVYVDSGPAGDAVEIRTPLGEVRDIGTRFEVRFEEGLGRLRIRVRDGEVELQREGRTEVAGAGEEMLQRADGSFTRGVVATHGEPWTWVTSTLPPFDIEGRTLWDLLTWATHEGGWQLRFADPALEAEVARAELFGSIEGFSLDEAISAMLAGSALTHRLEDGVLIVERAG